MKEGECEKRIKFPKIEKNTQEILNFCTNFTEAPREGEGLEPTFFLLPFLVGTKFYNNSVFYIVIMIRNL